jgi:hypothetical protein
MKKELQKEERLFERRAHTCDGGVKTLNPLSVSP